MGKKVLICDDAMFMRRMLRDIFEKNGYTVVAEAENGKDGYNKYKETRPDIVTMDITMPDYDGITGVKMISSEFPEANILMCSAMGQESMVIDSIKSGAKGFIIKPFVENKIISEVEKILG